LNRTYIAFDSKSKITIGSDKKLKSTVAEGNNKDAVLVKIFK